MQMRRLIIQGILLLLFITNPAIAQDFDSQPIRGWHDDLSGYDVFRISHVVEENYSETIVMHDTVRDRWLRLQGEYRYFWQPWRQDYPTIGILQDLSHFNPYLEYYFDIAANQLVLGHQYDRSPDKKWGIQENSQYDTGQKVDSLLLKDYDTGKLTEWFKSGNGFGYQWLPDSTLLYCTYGAVEKQNVIDIYDPAAQTCSRVVAASLRGISPDKKMILYQKNEPTRASWVRELSSGRERRFNDEKDAPVFYQNAPDTSPLLPENLNLESLESITPQRLVQFEYELIINDRRIMLPVVYTMAGKVYIPIRPLMQPLQMGVNIQEQPAGNRDYSLIYRSEKFLLSSGEYINYNWQLCASEDALHRIGIGPFEMQPILDPAEWRQALSE